MNSMVSAMDLVPELPRKRSRPLPPPQSRENVIMQSKEASDWQIIDSGEDLLIHWVNKRQKLRQGRHQNDSSVYDNEQLEDDQLGGGSSVNDPSEYEMAQDELSQDDEPKDEPSADNKSEDELANTNQDAGRMAVNEITDSQFVKIIAQPAKKPLFQSEAGRKAARLLALRGNNPGRDVTADLVTRGKDRTTSQTLQELEYAHAGPEVWSFANNVVQADVDNKCEAYELMKLTSSNDKVEHGSETDQDHLHVATTLATMARTNHEEQCCRASRENRERNLASQNSLNISVKDDSNNTRDSKLLHSPINTHKSNEQNDSVNISPRSDGQSDATSATLASYPEILEDIEDVAEAGLNACQAHVEMEYQNQVPVHLRQSNIGKSGQRINPYSRVEANYYRTQDRHITDTATAKTNSAEDAVKLSGEDRLRQLTRLHQNTNPPARIMMNMRGSSCGSHTTMKGATKPRREWRDDVTVPNHNTSNPDAHNAERDCLGGDNQAIGAARVDSTLLHPRHNHIVDNPSYSMAGRGYSYSRNRPVGRSLSTTMQFPPQGERNISVTLPADFDQLDPDQQDVIKKHEILKERKRDLEAASQGVELLSKLAANKHLDKTEQEWLATHQLFLTKVVKEERSGKSARPKIRAIINSLRGRIGDKQDPTTEEACSKLMFSSYLDLIEEDLANIIESMPQASKLRREIREPRRREKPKTQETGERLGSLAFGKGIAPTSRKTNPSHESDTDLLMSDEGLATVARSATSKLTINERKRMAQFKHQDQQLDKLKAKLQEFAPLSLGCTEPDIMPQIPSMATGADAESVTSEEDCGDEYYIGARILNTEMVGHTANDKPEELHQRKKDNDNLIGKDTARGSNEDFQRQHQTSDEHLNPIQPSRTHIDPTDHAEFNEIFQAIDTKKSSSENELYKYLVTAVFHGVQDHEDGTMYDFGQYLDRDHANDIVDRVAADFKYAQTQSQDYKNDKSINERVTQNKQGLRERLVEVGEDAHASCRVVLERELYNSSGSAYQNARVQAAVNAKPIYLVLWKKSVRIKADHVHLLDHDDGCARIHATLHTKKDISNDASQGGTGSAALVNHAVSDNMKDFGGGIGQGANALDHEFDVHDEDDLFGPDPLVLLDSETPDDNLPNILESFVPIQDPNTSKWNTVPISTAIETTALEVTAASITKTMDPASMPDTYTFTDLPTPPDSVQTVLSRASPITQPIHSPIIETTSTEDGLEMIQEPHYSEIQYCTSIATANRFAKDLFMQYFQRYHNHPKDFTFLRKEEDHIERELEDFADIRTWERTTHVETTIKKRDRKIPATETYRVWVAETWLKGPAN